MLQNLHVKNIALIDDVEIDFSDGLNILTGETGAGKSILIDSVNFALGGKIHKDVVRDGAEYALAELIFQVVDDRTIELLKELEVSPEDGQVILQRRMINGKSISRINGETVPASVVRDVAALLIDVHGQHEHQSLLYKKNHKAILDEFCGDDFAKKKEKLDRAYAEYHQALKEYDEAVKSSGSTQQDIDYSTFVVNEIEAANLKEGEDEELEKEFARMNNARRISEAVQEAENYVSSDSEGAGSLISRAVSAMKSAASLDEDAGELYEQLSEIENLVQDFNRALFDYEDTLEFSQEDYASTEERLNEINRLKMKYGKSIADILKKCEEESAKIERLLDFDNYINNLMFKKQKLYGILLDVCFEISEVRKKEARNLEADIIEALNNLNFLDAHFEIRISSDEAFLSRDGYDDIEFMISTNPGENLKPLTMVASGGELSRIMLALKSVLAKRDSIGTLIFDEIDTGISGKTAQRVADRMSEIAKCHQVICITHLPQIASHATTHFMISKNVEGIHTSTGVRKLDYDESVEELARMLSGETITEAVRNNAAEMKKNAGLVVE